MNSKKTAGIKKYVKSAGNAVSALSILFVLAALLRTDFDVITVTDWKAFLLVCLAGVFIKTFTVFLSGRAWCGWLEFFSGKRCGCREALRVYAKANIGKYLPGNVMHYVERNLFAGKLELSQKQIAAASIIEVLCLIMAAFFMGILLAFSQLRGLLRALAAGAKIEAESGAKTGAEMESDAAWEVLRNFGNLQDFQEKNLLLLFAACACVLAAVCAGVLVYCRRKWLGTLKGKGRGRDFGRTFCFCFLIYATVLVLLGFILVLVYWYMGGRPSGGQAVLMTAAYIIAWVLGFVVPGAPGGIGVRELALALLLQPVTGKDMIAALSVLHRLITVAGDFAAYLLSWKGERNLS